MKRRIKAVKVGLGKGAIRSLLLNAGIKEGADEMAALHAAAPDLLAALKETYAALTKADTTYCGREYALASNAARAAIEKAEGDKS